MLGTGYTQRALAVTSVSTHDQKKCWFLGSYNSVQLQFNQYTYKLTSGGAFDAWSHAKITWIKNSWGVSATERERDGSLVPPRPIYMPSIFHESAVSLIFQAKAARVPAGVQQVPERSRTKRKERPRRRDPETRVTQTTGPRYRKNPDEGA